jgi:hypothetical protein
MRRSLNKQALASMRLNKRCEGLIRQRARRSSAEAEMEAVTTLGSSSPTFGPPRTMYLRDDTLPVVIVEGERKALATSELGWQHLGDAAEHAA